MSIKEKFQELLERLNEIQRLDFAVNLLHWDLETYMPPKGSDSRSKVIATVSTIAFQKFISDEMGKLLEDILSSQDFKELDPLSQAIVKVTHRDYKRRKAIPPKLHHEFQETTARAQVAWREARAKSDYKLFQPHLEKVLKLSREIADLIGYDTERYDALLEDFEPGFRAEEFAKVASTLKRGLKTIMRELEKGHKPSEDILKGEFPEDLQEKLVRKAVEYIGISFDSLRIDKSAHPFTITIGTDDVRITVRYSPKSFTESLMAALHEGGHALYELGIAPILKETPLGTGASYGMHESQSRFWENIIGRSKPFWRFIWTELTEIFGDRVKGHPDDYFKAVNLVKPSFIRVEADEVTYNLHILLRFEIEREMINNPDFPLDSLPDLWNQKFQEYFGIVPPDHSKGVLQDIHWSFGAFGYFPTYTLGNLYSAQFYHALRAQEPQLFQGELSTEKLSQILKWFREKVHFYGKSKLPSEILRDATGEDLNPNHFLNYLVEKYSEVYETQISLEPALS